MLKINHSEFENGAMFQLRNSWRERIADLLDVKFEKVPVQFKVVDKSDCGYVCESLTEKKTDKAMKIVVANEVMQYTHAEEFPDCNVGLYMDDYLPLEGSKLLLKDGKNPSNIKPVQLVLSIEKLDDEDAVCVLRFTLNDLLLEKTYSIKSQIRNSWKLLSGPDTYMDDTEKMFQDTFIHKGYVMMVASKFAEWLRHNGQEQDAEDLLISAKIHDNSKIMNKDEFRALTSIVNDKTSMRDKNAALSVYKQDAIELHWKNNAHHPEHFSDIREMTRQQRQEAACDWCARSVQYGTDLVEFIEARQKDRFHFPDDIYDELLGYCKVLSRLMS